MKHTRTITAGLILTGALLGCAQQLENPGKIMPGSPTVEETRSTELQRVQFADIPVPSGFELVTRGNRSFSYQGGGVRLGRFRYWGKQPPEEVLAFYRRTMPLETYGWSSTSEKREQAESVLAFNKAEDSCIVTVHEEDGATIIRVKVSGQN